jgi:hypothetical protein
LQIGTSTLIGCETNPLGGVTTRLPQRGHASPVEVSIAYAVTSAEQTKAMGMNFVCKHAKVEPARWYY